MLSVDAFFASQEVFECGVRSRTSGPVDLEAACRQEIIRSMFPMAHIYVAVTFQSAKSLFHKAT